jgi:AraC-like DNA-binding protein
MQFESLRLDAIHTVFKFKAEQTTWRATNRKNHIIGINLSGVTHHDLGYKHMTLEPSSLYFFNQRDDYTAAVAESGFCYSVHFTTTEPIETESFCKTVRSPDEIVRLIDRLNADRASGSELKLRADFYALCHTIYTLCNAPYARTDPRILAAKEDFDLYFKEKDCLRTAVLKSGLTQRRFCDLFTAHFGTTPNRYILSRRIARARELLTLDYLSCREVAELCGFSDVYYFSKVFKTETGLAPTTFKRTV